MVHKHISHILDGVIQHNWWSYDIWGIHRFVSCRPCELFDCKNLKLIIIAIKFEVLAISNDMLDLLLIAHTKTMGPVWNNMVGRVLLYPPKLRHQFSYPIEHSLRDVEVIT